MHQSQHLCQLTRVWNKGFESGVHMCSFNFSSPDILDRVSPLCVFFCCFSLVAALFSVSLHILTIASHMHTVFSRIDADSKHTFILQKILFVIINLATLGMGMYKCSSIGLIPSTAADWLEFVPPPKVLSEERCRIFRIL